jgi:hypothetical protein
MTQDESDEIGREAYAASILLERRMEKRLERLSSRLFSAAFQKEEPPVVNIEGLARMSVELAKHLTYWLDQES